MQLVDQLVEHLRTHGPAFVVQLGAASAVVGGGFVVGQILAALSRRALRASGAEAFSTVVPGSVRVLAIGFGFVMGLDQLGLRVGTLLAGAGIVGLAVGFGSQAVVRDVVTGLFLIVDGAIKPGDQVKIGEASGVVEHIGLRMTEVRGDGGEVYYVANGTIGTVVNRSRGWARVSVEVPIPHDMPLRPALAALQRIAAEVREELGDAVLEEPEAHGIVALDPERAIVRVVAKVKAEDREQASAALRLAIREGFLRPGADAAGPAEDPSP